MGSMRTGNRATAAPVVRYLPAVLLLCVARLAVGAPFQNGSFELGPTQPVCNIYNIPVGDNTTITGWTVIVGNIDWEGPPGCGWVASDGNNSVDLVGDDYKGGVEQTFDTRPGVTYRVAFDLAGNYGALPVVKPLTVSVAGDVHEFSFDTTGATGSDMRWVTETFTFVATSSTATIQFVSDTTGLGGIGNAGAAIDNVRIGPTFAAGAPALGVPGLLLAAAALLALGVIPLRRKRKP